MGQKRQSDQFVGSLVVYGGTIRSFSFDLATDDLELDVPQTPYSNQPKLDPALRGRIERAVREELGVPPLEIRYGVYHCRQCRRWVDVTVLGNWSRSICAQCSLDRGSELHEHYAAATPRKKPAISPSTSPSPLPSLSPKRQAATSTVRSAQPTVDPDDDQLGGLIHLARADLKIKAICLLAALGACATIAIVWPEFKMRFGGLYSWALTLWYNPRFAAPGLMLVLAFGAGIWALVRFVHYLRLQAEVREYGIRIRPSGQQAFWEDIEEMRYAQRRLGGGGSGPARESLQLRPRDEKPIDLPHRFRDMQGLIMAVRGRVEPRLIEQAVAALEFEGKVSFGPLVTVERERLLLGQAGKELPFDSVKTCEVRAGQFFILDRDDKLVFARSAEFIPNATIIGEVVAQIRKKGS